MAYQYISTLIISTVFFFAPSSGYGATTDEYLRPVQVSYWETVGADPCRGNAECTPQWAIAEAERTQVIPASVASALLAQQAEGVAPFATEVCRGERFAMSFGLFGQPKFVPWMEAAFTDRECTAIEQWVVIDPVTGWLYRLFYVLECGNYGVGLIPSPFLENVVAAQVPQSMVSALMPVSLVPPITFISPTGPVCCVGLIPGEPGNPPGKPENPPGEPNVVPLPPSGLLLLAVLAWVMCRHRRRSVAPVGTG